MNYLRLNLRAGSSVAVVVALSLMSGAAAARSEPSSASSERTAAQTKTNRGSAKLVVVAAAKPANRGSAKVVDGESDASTGIEVVVVTANKREERANDVGLTISAFNRDELERQGVSEVADLTKVVPGFSATDSGLGTPVYTLRGVGFYENSLAAYPDVSVYVDEAPLPFPVLANQVGLDFDRVEVLKGPQGILFGENSTGGAINYIAAKPTDEFSAGMTLSYGRFDTIEGQGYVSGPLSDTVEARVALKVVSAGDWQYSYTRPNETSGKKKIYDGRALLSWDPNNRLHFLLNVNGYQDGSDPQAAQYSGLQPQIPAFAGPYLATPFAPPDPRAANWSPSTHPRGNQNQAQASLRADYDLTDELKLTSITSYIQYHRNMTFDNDGVFQHDLDTPLAQGFINSFSQEVRLAGTMPSWRWVVGGNYEIDYAHENNFLSFGDATSSQIFHFFASNFHSVQHMSNFAFFANAEHDITDDLTLKAGVRFTEANRSFRGCLTGDPNEQAVFTAISEALVGHPIPPLGPGDCNTINSTTGLPGLVVEQLNENNVSWRVGVDYHVSPSALLYLNVSKGYKAGSIPTLPGATTLQYKPVKQESLLDYEAGFKAQAFDNRLELNGALFYYDYTNKQLLAKAIDPVFGALDALVNIPKSRVEGAELSATAEPIPNLIVSASGAYLDAVVTKYIGVSGIGTVGNFAGTPVPFTPRWQAALVTDYNWEIGGVNVFVGQTSTYNISTFSVVGADPTSFMKSYFLLDLRAGFTLPDKRWRFSAFGRNVTNEYYWTNATRGGSDTIVRYAGMPATWGAQISFRY